MLGLKCCKFQLEGTSGIFRPSIIYAGRPRLTLAVNTCTFVSLVVNVLKAVLSSSNLKSADTEPFRFDETLAVYFIVASISLQPEGADMCLAQHLK